MIPPTLKNEFHKACTKCGEDKNASEFYVARHTKDGLCCACISCVKLRNVYDVPGRPAVPLFSRWADKVLVGDGCWEWTGTRNSQGYGAVRAPTKNKGAHRVSYELFVGPIPDGLHVCHHCDNPGCVKPSHLFVGTPADNMHDRDAKSRGNQRGGEQHPNAKLSGADVLVIRELCESGSLQKVVANRFGVTFQEISKVVTRKIWKSL